MILKIIINTIVILIGIRSIMQLFADAHISTVIQSLVNIAETEFEKGMNKEKIDFVIGKLKARMPIVMLFIPVSMIKKKINEAVIEMQHYIGTTGDRIVRQAKALEYINEQTILRMKELSIDSMANILKEKDFFGNKDLCSNFQIDEAVKEIKESTLEKLVIPNLEKIKNSIVFKKIGKI